MESFCLDGLHYEAESAVRRNGRVNLFSSDAIPGKVAMLAGEVGTFDKFYLTPEQAREIGQGLIGVANSLPDPCPTCGKDRNAD